MGWVGRSGLEWVGVGWSGSEWVGVGWSRLSGLEWVGVAGVSWSELEWAIARILILRSGEERNLPLCVSWLIIAQLRVGLETHSFETLWQLIFIPFTYYIPILGPWHVWKWHRHDFVETRQMNSHEMNHKKSKMLPFLNRATLSFKICRKD